MAENRAPQQNQPNQAQAQERERERAAQSQERERAGRREEEPPSGRAAPSGTESVASADRNEVIPDALGEEPQRQPAANQPNQLADKTQVKEFGTDERTGEPITAAATDPKKVEMGAYGMSVPHSGEVAGGAIEKLLEAPLDEQMAQRPMTKEQAAMMTPVYQKIAGLVARPPSEWGLLGPGDTVRGHQLLLDLNTGQKVRGMDGHRVNKGELYANLRNLPEALTTGDTIQRVLGNQ